jgi:hypothetical protein
MRRNRGAVLGLFVLVLGVFSVTATTAAAAPPSSLETEHLAAGPDSSATSGGFATSFHCNLDQSGTIDFTATSGVAVGPYPGFFMESGTVTVGPGGTITGFDATFEITNPIDSTVVTGTKTLLAAPANTGACATFFGGAGFDIFFDTLVSYTATITLPDGSAYRDTGTGEAIGHDALPGGFAPVVGPPEDQVSLFEEGFDHSNGVVLIPSTGKVTGGGWILGPPPSLGRVSFGFEAQSNPNGLHATCTVLDHATKTQIKCRTIDNLVVTGTHAQFSGMATYGGAPTHYTIDVDDLGEPGALDTFKIVLGNGYTAAGTLLGGNIQIH